MDLRQRGEPFEKKFTQFSETEIEKIALNYHNWQQDSWKETYQDIPEYTYSATLEEIRKKDYSLVPSKYIECVDQDSGIDFDLEMKRFQEDFKIIIKDEKQSQEQLINAFKVLGYEL